MTPEKKARVNIDTLLVQAGWHVCDMAACTVSLSNACLRLAGADQSQRLTGDMEMLNLSGTVGTNGSHFHITLFTATGQVIGGHVAPGCIVRTTAEVLLALLPEWEFAHASDAQTGSDELVLRPVLAPKSDGRSGHQVRVKLAGLGLQDADVPDAVAWVRKSGQQSARMPILGIKMPKIGIS